MVTPDRTERRSVAMALVAPSFLDIRLVTSLVATEYDYL